MVAPKPNQLYTAGDVAAALRVTRQTVTGLIRKGKIRGFKAGKDYRITGPALRAAFPDLFESGGPLADTETTQE